MARVPSCHLTFAAAVLFDDDGGWVSVPWVGGRSSSLPVAVWAWQGMNLNLEVGSTVLMYSDAGVSVAHGSHSLGAPRSRSTTFERHLGVEADGAGLGAGEEVGR